MNVRHLLYAVQGGEEDPALLLRPILTGRHKARLRKEGIVAVPLLDGSLADVMPHNSVASSLMPIVVLLRGIEYAVRLPVSRWIDHRELSVLRQVGQMGGKVWKELKYTKTRKRNAKQRLSQIQKVEAVIKEAEAYEQAAKQAQTAKSAST